MSRPVHQDLDDALAAVLGDMRQAVEQFAKALEDERQALDARDSDALDQAGSRKQAVLLQLEQLDGERRQLRDARAAPSPTAETAWAGVVQALQRCQLLNQRNGSVVHQRLSQVRQALAVLTGHANQSELYGRSGELQASLRSKVLAAV
jgi:flagella synthesis protein FlgN